MFYFCRLKKLISGIEYLYIRYTYTDGFPFPADSEARQLNLYDSVLELPSLAHQFLHHDMIRTFESLLSGLEASVQPQITSGNFQIQVYSWRYIAVQNYQRILWLVWIISDHYWHCSVNDKKGKHDENRRLHARALMGWSNNRRKKRKKPLVSERSWWKVEVNAIFFRALHELDHLVFIRYTKWKGKWQFLTRRVS